MYISNHMSELPGGAPPQTPDGALRAKDHQSYPQVEALCAKYPVQAGALFQTFVDLQFSARWRELQAVDVPRDPPAPGGGLGSAGWAVVRGIPRDASDAMFVVPMDLDETLTAELCVCADSIHDIFARLDVRHVLMAMMSNDGTVVYYRLSQGMVKPVN